MSRLIDADELKLDLKWLEDDTPVYHDVMSTIDEMATVEAVAKNETTTEVVRCKDCVYCKRFNDVWYLPKKDELLCTLHVETYHTDENDYCSWGERREDVRITDNN